jgi:hypothetical protein
VEADVPDCQGQQVKAQLLVFPALYNGPLNYYARLVNQQEILLEQHDSYIKQTYRNRCLVMGPNGLITLSIPVKRAKGTKTRMRDIRIDYDSNWNRIHWRSLAASYASSPYFEYLADELQPVYDSRFTFLLDLNQQLLEHTLGFMGLEIPVTRSTEFTPLESAMDPRHFIHPKKDQAVEDPGFLPREYQQVFSDRLGFHPNLSILDLIFNVGPEALSYLHASLKT